MIFKVNKNSRVFTLDTGRLHRNLQSFGCNKFKIWCKNRSFFPKFEDVENLYKTQGVNGHFESIDKRKIAVILEK